MKRSFACLPTALLALSFFGLSALAEEIPVQASPRNATAERLARSADALQEFRKNANSVTRKLFDSARCILIAPRRLPDETSMGASGFVTCRNASNDGWTNPAAVQIADGGVVWSFAGSQMDLVILAQNPGGAEALQSESVLLGVDPAIQPGPLTEDQIRPQPATSPLLFSYEQSSDGIHAIQLGGATLSQESGGNAALYGKQLSTSDVFALKAANTKPASLSTFLAALPMASRGGM
jgi:lipid-binding SYLF domain-containing protein